MLDYMMLGTPEMIYGGSAYRCRRCSSGPITTSDGFMMERCINCGHWQHSLETVDYGFGRVRDSFRGFLKRLKERFFQCLPAGCNAKKMTTVSNP